MITAICAIATALFIGIAIGGLFSRPIADDLAYLQVYEHQGSVLGASLDQYLGHSGRLSQVTLVYVFFALFGNLATRIAPLVLLVVLAFSLALLAFTLMNQRNKYRLELSAVFGLLVSSSILITVPSLFDSLYWLTSSTVYITSLIGFILTATLLISIFKYKIWHKPLRLVFLLPIIILSQSFGEAGAISSIAISALATIWTILNKKWRHLLKHNLIVFAGLVAGFLVNLLSPGTATRRAYNSAEYSLPEIARNTLDPFLRMFSYIEWWHIALALLIAVAAFYFTPKTSRKISMKNTGIAIILVLAGFLMVSAITFGVSALSVGQWFAIRNYTVPHAVLFLSAVAILFLLLRLIDTKANGLIHKSSPALFIVCALLALPSAIYKESIYIRAMSVRDVFYSQREISIENQLSDSEKQQPVKVPPVQVLVSPTEAADLENPDRPQTDWVVEMIEKHYEIPNYEIINSPRYYCVPDSRYVRYDLTCGYTYTPTDD